MQAAWAQVGEIRKANDALVRIQFARYVGESMHKQHLSRLPLGAAAPGDARRAGQGARRGRCAHVYGTVEQSATAPAAMTAAPIGASLAHAARSRGSPTGRPPCPGQEGRDGSTGFKDFRRTYVEPDGIRPYRRPRSGAARRYARRWVSSASLRTAAPGRLTDDSPVARPRRRSPTACSRRPPIGRFRPDARSGWNPGGTGSASVSAPRCPRPRLPSRRVDTVRLLLVGVANSSAPGASPAAIDRSPVARAFLSPGRYPARPAGRYRHLPASSCPGRDSFAAHRRTDFEAVGTRAPTPPIGIGSAARISRGRSLRRPRRRPGRPRQRFETASPAVTDAVHTLAPSRRLRCGQRMSHLLVAPASSRFRLRRSDPRSHCSARRCSRRWAGVTVTTYASPASRSSQLGSPRTGSTICA